SRHHRSGADQTLRHRGVPRGGGRRNRFHRAEGRRHRPAGRQRRRQDDDDRHAAGAAEADLRQHLRARHRYAARPPSRAAADEFLLALRRPAAPPDRAAESARLRAALCRARCRRADRAAGPRAGLRRAAGSRLRRALRRAEDAGGAGQGADQRTRAAAARRADGLAGSRYRRLGAEPAGALPHRARRHPAAGVAQHGRGRAALPAGADDEAGPDRRPRHAGRADRPLRPQQPGRGVSRHRPRPGQGGGKASGMNGEIFGFSAARIFALPRRHWYVLSGSWTRIVELFYWPAVQMLMWGFLTQFLAGKASFVAQAFGVFLAGMMLWDSLFRVQLGVAISFLEEMWARNLGNLFVSPLRPSEFAASVLLMGVLRALVGMIPVSL